MNCNRKNYVAYPINANKAHTVQWSICNPTLVDLSLIRTSDISTESVYDMKLFKVVIQQNLWVNFVSIHYPITIDHKTMPEVYGRSGSIFRPSAPRCL